MLTTYSLRFSASAAWPSC